MNTKKLMKLMKDSVSMNLKPALPLTAYAGQYVHDVYGGMSLAVSGNSLLMKFEHHPNLTGNLEPLGGNRFLCTYSDPTFGVKVLPFTIINGKVKSVTVKVADFVEFTPYEFEKKRVGGGGK
jgi:hypothetical protein